MNPRLHLLGDLAAGQWKRAPATRTVILGAPIRTGRASPLRVATGGNANWSSESVAAARRPERMGRRDTAPSSRISITSSVPEEATTRGTRGELTIALHPMRRKKPEDEF